MDPDLVRQQAEEEMASRGGKRRGSAGSNLRIEPVLPMGGPMRDLRAPVPPPRASINAAVRKPPGWGAAMSIALSCTLGVVVGLVGGIMLGVKLQLVPWQSAAIGAAAGLLIGWRLASRLLTRRGIPSGSRRAFLPAMLILAIAGTAMFAAPHFSAPAGGLAQSATAAGFWKAVAGGCVIAVLLGALAFRRILRRGS